MGRVEVDIDLDESGRDSYLIINGRPVSLKACAALTPSMLAVLEELAKEEAHGGVFRVEHAHDGIQMTVRLTKIGIVAHAKAAISRRLGGKA